MRRCSQIVLPALLVFALCGYALAQRQNRMGSRKKAVESVTKQPEENVSSPNAQQCSLSLEQSPEVRGMRLGMSVEQLLQRYPMMRKEFLELPPARGMKKPSEVGQLNIHFFPSNSEGSPDKESLKGIDSLTIHFLDDKIRRIEVKYEVVRIPFDEFVMTVSEKLRLPNLWVEDTGDVTCPPCKARVLNCAGFSVTLFSNDRLILNDLEAEEIFANRWREKEKRERKFEP